ncbi:unnamed protein product, partial [Meganyctiphanes norvegica]
MNLFKRPIALLLILTLVLVYFIDDIEAKGGRGGGGGRGGRGGGRSRSRGGSGGGYGGYSPGFAKFGAANRWSYSGGRRFYYVGYYHGHSHYSGHGSGYYKGVKDEGEPYGPWMIMFFVLLGIFGGGFFIWLMTYCYL